MSVFLSERARDIQGWLPPSDVDGLEIRRFQYVKESKNLRYENGFIRNLKKPVKVSYPSNVTAAITGDWVMLSMKYFNHSERGPVWFYLLTNSSDSLKFFITDVDNPDGLELMIDDGRNAYTMTEAPNEVNYMIDDDQLKISMNSIIEFTGLARPMYANLTLVFAPDITFNSNVKFEESWYLIPRWLGGKSYLELSNVYDPVETSDYSVMADSYSPPVPHWSMSNVTDVADQFVMAGSGATGFIVISDIKSIGEITIHSNTVGGGLDITIVSEDINLGTLYESEWTNDGTDHVISLKRIYDTFQGSEVTLNLQATFGAPTDCSIQGVTISRTPILEYVIIVKNFDIQRGRVDQSFTDTYIPIFEYPEMTIPINTIDWRIKDYEMYIVTDAGSGIYTLFNYNRTDVTGDGTDVTWTMLYDNFGVTTLNFNYGLGASVRVFPIESGVPIKIGRAIYSEVAFRNRSYTVKDDHKVYQSHISGTGLFQPDSFPFDETLQFGFIKLDYEFEIVKALAISALEELVVITTSANYVYTVQLGQNIVFRRIKVMNGISGISSRKSLLRDSKGVAMADALVWANANGAYAYGGGMQPPQIISLPIRHYWLDNVAEDSLVTFFDPEHNEICFANGVEMLVYEVETSSWNRFEYDYSVREFIGLVDNVPYFLASNGNRYKVVDSASIEFLGSLTTHPSAGYSIAPDGSPAPVGEIADKIFQELYLSIRSTKEGAIKMTIIADGTQVEEPIYFNTVTKLQNILAYLGIRYHHVQIKLDFLIGGVEVREFGYTFSVIQNAPGSLPYIGSGTGYGINTGGGPWGINM